VVKDGELAATCLIKIDGGTAVVDSVETAPEHRGRGHGHALLAEALALAGEAGCDLVTLEADAADWPRYWYARLGFTEVGRAWSAARRPTRSEGPRPPLREGVPGATSP
jgi:ribosomal protein S18 acetylase RimI-like enzyme